MPVIPLNLKKRSAAAATPEALQAAIAAAEEEAKHARSEAERLLAESQLELDDDKAEALLARSRAQDRAARRDIELRIPELKKQLVEAQWTARQASFERFKRELTRAGRDAIEKLQIAAAANFKLAQIRDAASKELGSHVTQIPYLLFSGLLLPDLIAAWVKHTARSIEQLEHTELPRPPTPGAAPDPRPGPIHPRPGPVVVARGEILSNRVETAPAAPAAVQETPAPVPTPAPRRERRRDGAPGSGERQVHFLSGGGFSLPDGSLAGAGDYVNLPAEAAQKFVERGVANFVDVPALVEGHAKMEIDMSQLLGGGR